MTTQLDSSRIADYLLDHPHFFEEHAELLSTVKLPSPVLGRAISLQERQMEILRDKIRTLELQAAKVLRTAQENDAIADKFHQWTCAVLTRKNAPQLPQVIVDDLVRIFDVPAAALRLWELDDSHSQAAYAAPVSDAARQYASALTEPYCGPSNGIEVATWLDQAETLQSIVCIPLRPTTTGATHGLLVLGSSDAARFSSDMGTDFLRRIGETASAAISHIYTTQPV
jgi:uncharacterized protein YigA (DUF484 family)